MSDNIAAQPENMAKTRKLFTSILVRPLNERSLQRPPFKFLQELIKNVVSETRLLADLYTTQDLDTNRTLDKSAKIAFLQKLIVFLDSELDKTMKVEVKAARIVAGLDPDKTNLMLQALAYVIMSRKTGKSIQSIASSADYSRLPPRRDSSSNPANQANRASISKQNATNTNLDHTKRSDIGSVSVASKQLGDSRPSSSRISSSNSIHSVNEILSPTAKAATRKNSSASSNKAANNNNLSPNRDNRSTHHQDTTRRDSSNVRSRENKVSPTTSANLRPTTSSKPPPRVVKKEDLAKYPDSTVRQSTTRPGTASNHNQVVNLSMSESTITSQENNNFSNSDSMKANDTNYQKPGDISSDSPKSNKQKMDGAAKTTNVSGRINDFEEVINKNELMKLMKYQDGLKKFDANKSAQIDQGPLVDELLRSGSEAEQITGTGRKSTSIDNGSSGVMGQEHLDKISEQTDKMKQGLKILTQFIAPANKAVNFIFEDFESIRTDYDKCLELTRKNMENNSKSANRVNNNISTQAMARLNDLEVKIEKATEQVDTLKAQLVQNETKIRQKLSYQASMIR